MPEHERRHVGQPSLLTPAVQETICAAIRRGCYATVAATRAGVDDFTISIWDKRGQREAEQRALGKVSKDTPDSVFGNATRRGNTIERDCCPCARPLRATARTLRTDVCDGMSLHCHDVTGVTGAATRTRCA